MVPARAPYDSCRDRVGFLHDAPTCGACDQTREMKEINAILILAVLAGLLPGSGGRAVSVLRPAATGDSLNPGACT